MLEGCTIKTRWRRLLGRLGRSRGITITIWFATGILLVEAPAHAHHIICKPHYVTDSDYPEPILTLAENVGLWRVQMIHAPGNPSPDQPTDIRFQVSSLSAGNELGQPVSVRILRQQAFGSGVDIYGPQLVAPEEDTYELRVTYPEKGNYLVFLTLQEGEKPTGLVLPIVVGQPGQPLVILASFILGVGILMLVVRAIKIKQSRQRSSSA